MSRRSERDKDGCYPGCKRHGCAATRCGEFKDLWRARERAAARDLEDGVVEAAEVDYGSGVYDSPRLLASLEDRDDVDVDRLDRDLDTARDDWDRFVAEQEGN